MADTLHELAKHFIKMFSLFNNKILWDTDYCGQKNSHATFK